MHTMASFEVSLEMCAPNFFYLGG